MDARISIANFKFESQMREPVRKWLAMRGLQTQCEVPVPWGICDIVAASLNKKKVSARLLQNQRRTIGTDLKVELLCRIISSQPKSITELTRTFGGYLSQEEIQNAVDDLAKKNFVEMIDEELVAVVKSWFPLQKRIVAVELKLSRIDDVMQQAIANKQLTNRSYIALPSSVAKRVIKTDRYSERLTAQGLGLLAVWKTKCEELLKPSSRDNYVRVAVQTKCVERFWRSLPKDKTS